MKMTSVLLLPAILLAAFACSEGDSKPVYKYKAPTEDGVAAKMGDITITQEEMNKGIEAELYEAEQKIFDIKFNKIRTIIMEKLMEADPRKKGLSNDEYMDKYIASSIKITDNDINAFVKERNIPQDQITPELKGRIENFLSMQKKGEAVESWLAEKSAKTPIEIFVKKPRRPSFDVDLGKAPVLGPETAKVTIVEFSDFQCPYCSKASETVHEIKKKYGNKVRVAFKQYPLPFHKDAKKAAIAALCANEQSTDKFWKLHDVMFGDQTKLSVDELKKSAEKIGLKTEEFNNCLDSDKFAAQIEADIKQGQDLGVKSTPTFFVNGMLVSGAQPVEVFSDIIDDELASN